VSGHLQVCAGCGHDRSTHHFNARGPGDCLARGCPCKAYLRSRDTLPAGALALLLAACSTWAQTGRVVDGRCVHVGVRPASDGLGDYALTVQVTTDAPACDRVYQERDRP
jgi:hypothetical protein